MSPWWLSHRWRWRLQACQRSPPLREPSAGVAPGGRPSGRDRKSLRNGESDLELRFSDAGLDLLKASSGAAIGRLLWSEIHSVDVASARRGLRPGRRVQELHIKAQSGRAIFQLPGMTSEQVSQHLEPALARLRGDRDRS